MRHFFLLLFLLLVIPGPAAWGQETRPLASAGQALAAGPEGYAQGLAHLQQEMDNNIEEIANVSVLVNQAKDESDLQRLKLLVRSIGEKIRVINERKALLEEEYRTFLELDTLEKEISRLDQLKQGIHDEILRSPERVTPSMVESARLEWETAKANRQFERLQFQEVQTEEQILKTESEENEIAQGTLHEELGSFVGTDWEKKAKENEFFVLEQRNLLLEAKRHLLNTRKELLEVKDRTYQLTQQLKGLRLASLQEKEAHQRGEEAFTRFEDQEGETEAKISPLEQQLDGLRTADLNPEEKARQTALLREEIQKLRHSLSLARLDVSIAHAEERIYSPLVHPAELQRILQKEQKTLEGLEVERGLLRQRRAAYEQRGDSGILTILREEEEISSQKIEKETRLIGLANEKIGTWGGMQLWYRHRYLLDPGMFVPLIRNIRSLPHRIPEEVKRIQPVRWHLWGHPIPTRYLLSGLGILFIALGGASLWFRGWTHRRIAFLRTKAAEDYAIVIAISLVRLVGRNLFPVILAAGLLSAHWLLGLTDLVGLPILSLLGIVIAYFASRSILQELFDPRGKEFRLLPLEPSASLFIYRWLHWTLLALIVPILGFLLLQIIGASDAINELGWLALKFGLLGSTAVALFAKKRLIAFPRPSEGIGRFFYRLLLVLYTPMVLSSMALLVFSIVGYQNFAHAVFAKAGWVVLVLVSIFIVRRVSADQLRRWISPATQGLLEGGLLSFVNLTLLVVGLAALSHLLGLEIRTAFGGGLWSLLVKSWTTVGGTPLTILSLAKALVVFLLFFYFSRLVCGLLDEKIYPKFAVDEGVRSLINTIVEYGLLAFGALAFLSVLGIRLTTLAVFAGAVGVGLGFGLQNIANNFVSGLILLFERPIKKGDFVQVGTQSGIVQRIGSRSTQILTGDNIAIIVPNSELIGMSVTNWSHRDPKTRARIPVGVAYGTDVEKLDQMLKELAAASKRVLKHPPPEVTFKGFGASSLDFELLVWVDHPRGVGAVQNELLRAIEKKFRESGIEIPFPQSDVHFRTALDLLKPI